MKEKSQAHSEEWDIFIHSDLSNSAAPLKTDFEKAKDLERARFQEEKRELSKNWTVAPAYNKGAYQVIPKSDVKHIGK